MIDFELSAEQRTRREWAREFSTRCIAPAATEADRLSRFPWEVVEEGVRAGLTKMLVPVAYGGLGFDCLSAGLVLEELGAACAGIATIFGASILGTGPIVLLGSEEQKQRLLRRLADPSDRFLCAFAVTEAGAGSAAASADPRHGVKTYASRDGDAYVLTGSKRYISNGSAAQLYTVLARTHPSKGMIGGLSFFAVDAAQSGVRVGRVEEKMGQRACPAAELFFEDVRLAAEDLLGTEGLGGIGLLQTISISTALVGALCVGLARRATALALEHAHRAGRLQQEQLVAMRLFDMAVAVEAARDVVWRALWENDRRRDAATGKLRGAPSLKASAMAKVFASDACVRLADEAAAIIGPQSLSDGHPAEKLVRDAKLMQIFEGTNEIHRISAASLLRGEEL